MEILFLRTLPLLKGYTIEKRTETCSGDDFINISVRTCDYVVDNRQMTGGLPAHTFDADDADRNGKTGPGARGEGAIDGVAQDEARPARSRICSLIPVLNFEDCSMIWATVIPDNSATINGGYDNDSVA